MDDQMRTCSNGESMVTDFAIVCCSSSSCLNKQAITAAKTPCQPGLVSGHFCGAVSLPIILYEYFIWSATADVSRLTTDRNVN